MNNKQGKNRFQNLPALRISLPLAYDGKIFGVAVSPPATPVPMVLEWKQLEECD